jgi:hypothetical protein
MSAGVDRRTTGVVLAALLVAVMAGIYLFIGTGGRLSHPQQYTIYYDMQAEGFRRGQLHLSVEPLPELLQKENPFDPSHRALWLWDATLYNRHYYIYWGPVPALILAALKSVIPLPPVGDQYFALVFSFLRFLVGMTLILSIARWFWVRALSAPSLLAVVLFGLATPMPYFLARGAVYEAAIAAGQFFLLAGLTCAFWALVSPGARRASRWLVGAGVCWALALGSRLSLLPCVGVLVLLVCLARFQIEERPGWRRALALLTAVGLPVALSLAGLALFNYARFGSFTEVGVKSQLTWMHFRWSAVYIPLNVAMYLFRPPVFSCQFPFVNALWMPVDRALPSWWTRPPGYDVEPLAGLLTAAPFNLLAVIPLLLLPAALLLRLRPRRDRLAPSVWLALAGRSGATGLPWPALFIVSASVVIATLPALGYIGMWLSSMRYAVDISAGVTLLAAMGSWILWTAPWPGRWMRVVVIAICVTLAAVTVAIGLPMGTQGYQLQMERQNPALWKQLSGWRVCD